ncbi:MAG: thiol reductant ABC exporter subunit CydC [Rhodospirillaceae bacterium]|nr:thiol reductant ABC exporter subunit CydC [Rhodospirillaceae bacterium]
MRHRTAGLWTVLAVFRRHHGRVLTLGIGLTAATLAAGALLLGLSGWFLTAAAAAGLAGAGMAFDVFGPAAAIRFLALVRTGARYGERLANHDATLRVLAALRLSVFRALAARPLPKLAALRRGVALNRLTADIDALDGLHLRLVLPVAAGAIVLAVAAALLAWLVAPVMAAVVGLLVVGGGLSVLMAGRPGAGVSRRRGLAQDALRVRLLDLARGRADLAVAGRLPVQIAACGKASNRALAAGRRLNALDLKSEAVLSATVQVAVVTALVLGVWLAQAGTISGPVAAIGVFAAIALGEVLAPLRRGALEIGRILLAVRRIAPALAEPVPEPAAPPRVPEAGPQAAPLLEVSQVDFAYGSARAVLEGVSLALSSGDTVALVGRSGGGKTTLLWLAAGVLRPTAGSIHLCGCPLADWPEAALRARIGLLPQRSELFAGTIAENLRVGAPDAPDDELRAALAVVGLVGTVDAAGGLAARLGEGGAGLSGGEARRLALARLILRRPQVLLLDEPTSGLDAPTAAGVMARLRAFLPDAAILVATHRAGDLENTADVRIFRLSSPPASTTSMRQISIE